MYLVHVRRYVHRLETYYWGGGGSCFVCLRYSLLFKGAEIDLYFDILLLPSLIQLVVIVLNIGLRSANVKKISCVLISDGYAHKQVYMYVFVYNIQQAMYLFKTKYFKYRMHVTKKPWLRIEGQVFLYEILCTEFKAKPQLRTSFIIMLQLRVVLYICKM